MLYLKLDDINPALKVRSLRWKDGKLISIIDDLIRESIIKCGCFELGTNVLLNTTINQIQYHSEEELCLMDGSFGGFCFDSN